MNGITEAFIRFWFYEFLVTDSVPIHGSMKPHTKGRYVTAGTHITLCVAAYDPKLIKKIETSQGCKPKGNKQLWLKKHERCDIF
jgi:hypothetical protein